MIIELVNQQLRFVALLVILSAADCGGPHTSTEGPWGSIGVRTTIHDLPCDLRDPCISDEKELRY